MLYIVFAWTRPVWTPRIPVDLFPRCMFYDVLDEIFSKSTPESSQLCNPKESGTSGPSSSAAAAAAVVKVKASGSRCGQMNPGLPGLVWGCRVASECQWV